jgi:hypothetical protein
MTSELEGSRLSALGTGRVYPQDYPGTHFKRLSRPRGHGIVGCHGKIPSDTIGDRSRDLPTSSVVPLPLRHPRPYGQIKATDELLYKGKVAVKFTV